MAEHIRLTGTLSPSPGKLSGSLATRGKSLQGSLQASGGGRMKPATTSSLGGIIVGSDLQITEEGVLSVWKADSVQEDNTHPITSAAVYTEVGNINALLETI